MKTIYGIKGFALDEFAISANAELGIRDSGKTYAGCEAAEELFDAGIPAIAFDPIGKWHSLRIPGKGKGYPFVIAGGKFGDLPLTRKNAAPLVREAMKSGVSLVLDLFSREMTKADWRYIVQECAEVLLYENEDHGLRHVFIEEAGEFVPQRVTYGDVFNAVEKLVRMGGNSKLGCTLIHQRPADINKSVLELCANVFLLRQTGKNTLSDLKKWLAMIAEDQAKEIGDSLPDLKSGHGWLFAHTLQKVTAFQVPERNSKHPDRREKLKDPDATRRAAVPADKFIDAMKAALAEKPKPPAVPAQSKAAAKTNAAPDQRAIDAAFERGRQIGYGEGWPDGYKTGWESGALAERDVAAIEIKGVLGKLSLAVCVPRAAPRKIPPATTAPAQRTSVTTPIRSTMPIPPRAVDSNIPGNQARVLNSLATWASMGHAQPSNAQVAWLAGYSPNSTSYTNPRGAARQAALLDYPAPDRLALTAEGQKFATRIEIAGALLDYVLSQLPGNEARVLKAAASFFPASASNEQVAELADYSASSTSYTNPRGALKSKELITYPSNGQVRAADWLFQEAS